MPQVRLTHDEQRELLLQLRQTCPGSPQDRDLTNRLLLACHGYVVSAASRCANATNAPVDDLVQEGLLAVLPRLRTFDPAKSPATWAFPGFVFMIAKQAMFRWAQTQASPVHVTRWASKQVSKAKKIARDQGVPLSDALETVGASADAILVLGEGEARPAIELDEAPFIPVEAETQEEALERLDLHAQLATQLHHLPRRLQTILRQTYGIAPSQALPDREIARRQGLTLDRLRQRRAEALQTLREHHRLSSGAHHRHQARFRMRRLPRTHRQGRVRHLKASHGRSPSRVRQLPGHPHQPEEGPLLPV